MLIKSLEQMENIVENNESLSWNGWDVLEVKKNSAAWMKPEGAFINNAWSTVKRYPLSENGWELPAKFVRNNEQ